MGFVWECRELRRADWPQQKSFPHRRPHQWVLVVFGQPHPEAGGGNIVSSPPSSNKSSPARRTSPEAAALEGMSRALRGACPSKFRACPGPKVTASVLCCQFPPQKLSVPSSYLFSLGAFKYMTQPLQHRQLFSCSSPLPPSSDPQSVVLEPVPVSSVKMGYSEIDEKAINTIRVLAVSFSVSPSSSLQLQSYPATKNSAPP